MLRYIAIIAPSVADVLRRRVAELLIIAMRTSKVSMKLGHDSHHQVFKVLGY